MNKKTLLKYILIYLPVTVGVVMYSCGGINLFSSLLLFLGGYIAIKNTLDYRKVRKNMVVSESMNIEVPFKVQVERKDTSKKVYIKSMNPENIIGIKRTRVYKKVRRRIK